MSASLFAATALTDADRRSGEQAIDHRAALGERAVIDQVQRYLDAMDLVAAAAGAQPQLTRDSYLELTAPLVTANLPGATGVGFIVSAPDDQVGAVQAEWRRRGVPDLTLRPLGTGREHFFAVFSRTLDGSVAGTPGRDLSQAAEPAEALAEARRSGAVTLSRPYLLLRDRSLPATQRQQSFMLAAPVLGPADADGNRPFRGWVVTALRGQNFTGTILGAASEGLHGASLYATGVDGRKIRVATVDRIRPGHSDLRREVTIPVAQQHWWLDATAASGVGGFPAWIAGAGGLLALAVAGLVFVLMTARDRARAQVVRATERLEADIARRERVEADLRDARDQLHAQRAYLGGLLDSLDVAVVACDTTGRITVENAYSQSLRGSASGSAMTRADLRDHIVLSHLDGAPLTDDELPLSRTLREGSLDALEIMHHRADRRPLAMRVHGRTLTNADGVRIGAVITAYDVTEQREHERELAGFAGIAAHDLKSPLAVIAAYTELLSEEATGEAAELLGRVDAGVRRMRSLIDDLLAYSTARDAALESADVDLRQVVADVVAARTDHLRLTAGQHFPDVYVGPLPAVRADPAMLRQLVDNLIGNALKYVRPDQAARVDITASVEGDRVRVEIADRGIGIPAAERATVFEPFRRVPTDNSYAGTGLGLAICQRIVDRHGGRIGVADNAGGGSRFFFTLPLARPRPVGADAAPVAGPAPAAGGGAVDVVAAAGDGACTSEQDGAALPVG